MIGSCLALAIAPLGLRVAIIELVPRSEPQQPSFDDRTTALSRSTQRMFEAMGLWAEVSAASTPITSIHVSDKGRFGFSHIDAEEQGVAALGHVVINRVLGKVLQTHLDACQNVDVYCPATIGRIELGPKGARGMITVEGKVRELNGRLLVAADGANSSVREMMGISAQKRDYQQVAVIGNLLTEIELNHRAFERFTQHGPLAILPVAEGRAGFVWTVSEADAAIAPRRRSRSRRVQTGRNRHTDSGHRCTASNRTVCPGGHPVPFCRVRAIAASERSHPPGRNKASRACCR